MPIHILITVSVSYN